MGSSDPGSKSRLGLKQMRNPGAGRYDRAAMLACLLYRLPMTARAQVSRTRLALLLGGLAMFGPFSIDTIFPAFRVIAHDLRVTPLVMQQTVSVYLIAYAAMALFHGPLSDAYGRRRVILSGVAVFALATVGCALSQDITSLLAFRALQGLSAGVGLIVGRAVIRDCLDGDDAQRMMSNITMIFGIAPAIAPVIGGWILGWQGWQAIFWFLLLFAGVLWTITLSALTETHPQASRTAFRPSTLLHNARSILGNSTFVKLALAGTMCFNALFVYIASAPAFVQDLMGLNERQYAWFFAPAIGGMMLGAFVSGRMAGRMRGVRLANIGFACGGAAVLVNIAYNILAHDLHPLAFEVFGAHLLLPIAVLPVMGIAFGIALVFPILTLALLDMYPRQRGAASSMQAFIGLLLNAIVAGALSPLLSGSGLHLALAASAFTAGGWLLWRGYARTNAVPLDAPVQAAAFEPADEM
ncbi:MAG: multidrug effflux MFS transporter [Pseudomonadota bacterium]|nr:multidrug effflux MFS transporter [Pseudomonadota bacterium]